MLANVFLGVGMLSIYAGVFPPKKEGGIQVFAPSSIEPNSRILIESPWQRKNCHPKNIVKK
jgi:hypothetical protein